MASGLASQCVFLFHFCCLKAHHMPSCAGFEACKCCRHVLLIAACGTLVPMCTVHDSHCYSMQCVHYGSRAFEHAVRCSYQCTTPRPLSPLISAGALEEVVRFQHTWLQPMLALGFFISDNISGLYWLSLTLPPPSASCSPPNTCP